MQLLKSTTGPFRRTKKCDNAMKTWRVAHTMKKRETGQKSKWRPTAATMDECNNTEHADDAEFLVLMDKVSKGLQDVKRARMGNQPGQHAQLLAEWAELLGPGGGVAAAMAALRNGLGPAGPGGTRRPGDRPTRGRFSDLSSRALNQGVGVQLVRHLLDHGSDADFLGRPSLSRATFDRVAIACDRTLLAQRHHARG